MSEPQFQEALDAVVRLATEPPEVPEPARSDQIENELRAVTSVLADLIQQPKRDPLESFFGAVRHAAFRLEDAISERHPGTGIASYCLGKLTALAEMAETVLSQKVPEPALRVLYKSHVAEEIASALRDHGSMRIADLAQRLGKAAQNLNPVLREMGMVGLVRREEIGRTVRLWPTPLTRAALKILADPGSIVEPGAGVQVEARRATAVARESREQRPAEPDRAAEPADPMRAYILDRASAVGGIRNADEQLRAARRAADGFAACADRGDRRLQPDDPQREVQERGQLVEAFIGCSVYFPTDPELRLFGSEPALYLPRVISSNNQGEIAVRVEEFFDASDRLSDSRYMPGPIAAQALARLAEREPISIQTKRKS